jgi:hypothetical protein
MTEAIFAGPMAEAIFEGAIAVVALCFFGVAAFACWSERGEGHMDMPKFDPDRRSTAEERAPDAEPNKTAPKESIGDRCLTDA